MADVVTDNGKEYLSNSMPETLYVGWGTGTAPGKTDTHLGFESEAEGRVSAVVDHSVDGALKVVATITAVAAKTVTEVGVFNGSTGGILIAAGSLSQAVQVGDKIAFTILINYTN